MFKSSREVALFTHHSTIIRVVKLVGRDALLQRGSTVTAEMQTGWDSCYVATTGGGGQPYYPASYIYAPRVPS